MADRKLALITGASSGIGEAYARLLAGRGYDLVLSARREELLEGLKEELRRTDEAEVQVIPADLSGRDGIDGFISRIEKHRFDMFVHSAGFGTRGLFADVDAEKSSGMVTLHVLAATMLTRAVLPSMLAAGQGDIVFISSLGAFLTTAEYTVYSATKSFLNTFIEGLRDETLPFGVRVQSICPGLTKTGFMSTDEYAEFDYSAVPDWAWMSPEKVARVSLKKLDSGKAIVVPGFGNRMFLGTLKMPLAGKALRSMMSAASRRRVARGEQSLF